MKKYNDGKLEWEMTVKLYCEWRRDDSVKNNFSYFENKVLDHHSKCLCESIKHWLLK